MPKSNTPRVEHPLKRISTRLGLRLEPLREAIAHKARIELPISSLQYYWDDKRFNGGVIPDNKLWRAALKEILMARGMTPEEARELFGNYYNKDEMSDLHSAVNRVEAKMDAILNALGKIGVPVQIDEPARDPQPPADND